MSCDSRLVGGMQKKRGLKWSLGANFIHSWVALKFLLTLPISPLPPFPQMLSTVSYFFLLPALGPPAVPALQLWHSGLVVLRHVGP